MVEKNFILKPQPFTFFNKVNGDNNNSNSINISNNNNDDYNYDNNDNHNENKHENGKNKKHNYVKVLVGDPFNKRDIILKVTKKQKGVYI